MLLPLGGVFYGALQVADQLGGRHGVIFVDVGFAHQALQQVVGKDAVPATPLVALAGEFIRAAGEQAHGLGLGAGVFNVAVYRALHLPKLSGATDIGE